MLNRTVLAMATALLLLSMPLLAACDGDGQGGGGGGEGETTPSVVDPTDTETGEATTAPSDSETQEAQRLVEVKCSTCHSLDRVWAAEKTRAEWAATVERMERSGLVLTEEEFETIVDHLAETQGE